MQETSTKLFERYFGYAISLKLQANMSRGGGAVSYYQLTLTYLHAPLTDTLPDAGVGNFSPLSKEVHREARDGPDHRRTLGETRQSYGPVLALAVDKAGPSLSLAVLLVLNLIRGGGSAFSYQVNVTEYFPRCAPLVCSGYKLKNE